MRIDMSAVLDSSAPHCKMCARVDKTYQSMFYCMWAETGQWTTEELGLLNLLAEDMHD